MANFNAQATSATRIVLTEYGYTHLETIGTEPVTIYFVSTPGHPRAITSRVTQ